MKSKLSKTDFSKRINLFTSFLDTCMENGIGLISEEFRQISAFALRDGPIVYGTDVKYLSDLEVEKLSDKDAAIILKRARTALKRILEMKTKYSRGPFYTNRKMRRIQQKLDKATTTQYKPS